jgi:branched-chain amino acid transport system substrate-binding protein
MTMSDSRKTGSIRRREFVRLAAIGAGGLIALPAVRARAQTVTTLKFGEIQALTGPSAAYGIRARDGSKMAVDEINAAGGFKDAKGNTYKLEQVQADMANDAKQAVTLLRQFAVQSDIAIVLGPTNSVGFIAMVPVAAQLGIVVLNNGSGAPVKKHSEWVYRVNPVSTVSVPIFLKKIHDKLQFKRLAVIYDQTQDAQAGDAAVCREQKAKLGYEIVADEAFRAGDQDFSAQISKIKAAKPDVIYVAGATGDGVKVTSQIRGGGLDQPLMTGFGSFQDPVYWDGTNGVVKGSYTWLAQDLAGATGKLKDWLERFKAQKFELEPTSFSTYGYDSVYTLVEAVKRAGGIERKALRETLSNLEFKSPIDTMISFKNPPTGDNLKPTVTVIQVTGRGTYVPV